MTIGAVYAMYQIPLQFKNLGVSDNITMMVLGTITAILVGYGIANVKDPKH